MEEGLERGDGGGEGGGGGGADDATARLKIAWHDDDSEEEEVPSYGFAKALQTAQQAFLLPDSTQPEVEWVEGAEQGAEEKEDSWAPSRVLQRAAGKAAAEEEAAEAAAEAAEAAAKAAAESQAACRHSSAQEREGGRAAAAAIIAAAAAPEPEDLLQGALQVPSRGAPTALDYWAKVKDGVSGGLLAGNGAGGASPQPPQQGLEPPTADTVGGGTRVGSEVGSAAGSAATSSAFGLSDEGPTPASRAPREAPVWDSDSFVSYNRSASRPKAKRLWKF